MQRRLDLIAEWHLSRIDMDEMDIMVSTMVEGNIIIFGVISDKEIPSKPI